jgi:hypothetical protein
MRRGYYPQVANTATAAALWFAADPGWVAIFITALALLVLTIGGRIEDHA